MNFFSLKFLVSTPNKASFLLNIKDKASHFLNSSFYDVD